MCPIFNIDQGWNDENHIRHNSSQLTILALKSTLVPICTFLYDLPICTAGISRWNETRKEVEVVARLHQRDAQMEADYLTIQTML